MANPAADLFNDATLAGNVSLVNVSGFATLVEEGAAGNGMLVLSCRVGLGGVHGSSDRVAIGPIAGDFDLALVLQCEAASEEIGETPALDVGVYEAADTTKYLIQQEQGFVGNFWNFRSFATGGVGLFIRSGGRGRMATFDGQRTAVVRFSRVGSAVQTGIWNRVGGWGINGPTSWFVSAADVTLFALLRSNTGANRKVYLRGLIPLTSGALSAPAAPTTGKAFSAPSSDDADLGVGFSWAAPASNVARILEVMTATDAGFTAGVQRHTVDMLMGGEKPSHRRGGVTLGTTVFGKARFIDELGQPGAWSADLSAAAALTPSVSPTYVMPPTAVRLSDGPRVVRLAP